MKTIEYFKKDWAIQHGWKNWDHFINGQDVFSSEIDKCITELMSNYATYILNDYKKNRL